ncbi:hypothetical protein XELAEV_18023761mg [Xenopus laevis]|uniref:Uncharacterized protein n=1 Tax=Xenopus laevis TaxID=8355 RepID=A0A974D7K3_XENLA|nr:hypothetical protein XELAEV_18023761mg [Xenopus laevis]
MPAPPTKGQKQFCRKMATLPIACIYKLDVASQTSSLKNFCKFMCKLFCMGVFPYLKPMPHMGNAAGI